MSDFDNNDLNLPDSFLSDIKKDIAGQVRDQVEHPRESLPNFEYVDDLLDDTTLSLTEDFHYFSTPEFAAAQAEAEEDELWEEEEEIPVRKTTAEPSPKKKNWFRRMPVWGKILTILGGILVIGALAGFLYYQYLLGLINIKPDSEEATTEQTAEETTSKLDQEEIDELNNKDGLEEIDEDDIDWNTISDYRKEEGILNFLFLGIDKQGGGKGRSDAIIIVTLNENTGELSLCSIMRDCYVKIPGARATKINVAHAIGEADLTVKTVQQNFNVAIDGYVEVDFDAFAKCIDAIGGVEVDLTQAEVSYLNGSHSSILDPTQRNVKVGKQTLNGIQALGYARIRKVSTSDGLSSDFGRTSRQRIVLNALFEKYKSSGALELLGMMTKILPLVTTDLSKDEITSVLYKVVAMKPSSLKTLSIPTNNWYSDRFVEGSGSVLALDMGKNTQAIHEFIFGSAE